jgi:hypothetical protein
VLVEPKGESRLPLTYAERFAVNISDKIDPAVMQGSIPMMGVLKQPVSMTGEDVAADSADEPRDEAEGGDDASNNWGKRHVKNTT